MEEKDKPRLSRLTATITQLQSKRIVTAKYLAEKHNVSVRTIYRDIGGQIYWESLFRQQALPHLL